RPTVFIGQIDGLKGKLPRILRRQVSGCSTAATIDLARRAEDRSRDPITKPGAYAGDENFHCLHAFTLARPRAPPSGKTLNSCRPAQQACADTPRLVRRDRLCADLQQSPGPLRIVDRPGMIFVTRVAYAGNKIRRHPRMAERAQAICTTAL